MLAKSNITNIFKSNSPTTSQKTTWWHKKGDRILFLVFAKIGIRAYSKSKPLNLLLLDNLYFCVLIGVHFNLRRKQMRYYIYKYHQAGRQVKIWWPNSIKFVFLWICKALCKTTPLYGHDSTPRLFSVSGQDLYQFVKCSHFVHESSWGQA